MKMEDHANGGTDNRIIIVTTREPCPRCGISLTIVYHPILSTLDEHVRKMQEGYPSNVPTDWADGYEKPGYLYCDSPICGYHAVAEWTQLRAVLPAWMNGTAPTWLEFTGCGQ